MATTWTNEPKNLVDDGAVYNNAAVDYDDASVQYGGLSTPVWTNETISS